MEPRRQKLSDLLHKQQLPPPRYRRALLYGTIVALLGAIACGMVAYTRELRTSYLTLAIGVTVGIAIIRVGGHGKRLAASAAVLTLLATFATYLLTFTLVTLSWCTEKNLADTRREAAAWQLLDNPTDAQVMEFAQVQGFDFVTREAFDHYPGTMLKWFAENNPTLSEWRMWEWSNSSLSDYLVFTYQTSDLIFVVIALLLAAGVVSMRTATLAARARQRAFARRQQELEQEQAS